MWRGTFFLFFASFASFSVEGNAFVKLAIGFYEVYFFFSYHGSYGRLRLIKFLEVIAAAKATAKCERALFMVMACWRMWHFERTVFASAVSNLKLSCNSFIMTAITIPFSASTVEKSN